MTKLKKPFLIMLDTFVLNNMSKDYFHKNTTNRQRIDNFLNGLYSKGAIPIITWHHIEEMLSHGNHTVSSKSIDFIRTLPSVAVIKTDTDLSIGSILDINKEEIQTVLRCANEIEISSIIHETYNNIYKFSTGANIIEPLMPHIEIIRKYILSKAHKNKEIASISRAKTLKAHYTYKLTDINNMENYTYSPIATQAILNDIQYKLIKEIKEKGDRKISSESAKQMVINFLSSIKIDDKVMDMPIIDLIQKNSGLSKDEFQKIKSWEDLECVPIFKNRLELIAKKFPESEKDKIVSLEEKYCPTWLLWKEIYKIRVKAERASGSDINDAFLAGLCLYSDLTIVDKRTHEYLTQIKRKDTAISRYIQSFKKLSCYVDILDYLPNK